MGPLINTDYTNVELEAVFNQLMGLDVEERTIDSVRVKRTAVEIAFKLVEQAGKNREN